MRAFITFLSILCFVPADAQVVINEFSASNLEEFTDEFGRTEDWVELFNTSNASVDISGWYLSDKELNPTKFQFPQGTIIAPNGYLLIYCSGRNLVTNQGEYHANFKLAQTTGKDKILLANASAEIQEIHELSLTLVECSIARDTDGSDSMMVCTDPTPGNSNDSAQKYLRYTQTPSMDKDAGFYSDQLVVNLTNNEPNSILRYTTDGTNVIESSPQYGGAITVDSTTVIKARAFSNDANILPGKMDFNTYFIDENDFTLAVFSVAADDVLELAGGQGELIPIGSIEYFGLDGERAATSFGSLNRHGQDSWVLNHRSLDWISRDEMGYSKAVNAPLFSSTDRDEYQKFMFRNSGDDNYPAINDEFHVGSTHVRDEYVQTLAYQGGMKLDTRRVERVIVFLNGQYWGVYGMRDRPVDHDYTDYYYDQGKFDIQYLSTWGDSEAEYGGDQAFRDWEAIRNFAIDSSMAVDANYQVVSDSINLLSMIDYMLVNLNVVASDWLNYNTGWWRGLDPEGDHKKWGYILWDLDATFDYYINYTEVPNISPNADPCDIEDISDYMDDFFGDLSNISGAVDTMDYSMCPSILNGSSPYPPDDEIFIDVVEANVFWFDGSMCCDNWSADCQQAYNQIEMWGNFFNQQGNVGAHEKIFLKLLEENADFTQLYYGRYADMMNTVFSCENMLTTLDEMIAVIEPEMDRQIERWAEPNSDDSREEWETNVERLKDFISARCELLDDGLIECYEVSGPYEITLMTEPDFAGEIDFNTLDIREFPWTGEYFGGMVNTIKARVFDEYLNNYAFSHWESKAGNVIFPSPMDFQANITLTQSDTLIAVFDAISSNDELEENLDLHVFPNPANQYITVGLDLPENAQVRFQLLDALGKEVGAFSQQAQQMNAGRQEKVLPLPRVTPGFYVLNISIDDKTLSRKVSIIQTE